MLVALRTFAMSRSQSHRQLQSQPPCNTGDHTTRNKPGAETGILSLRPVLSRAVISGPRPPIIILRKRNRRGRKPRLNEPLSSHPLQRSKNVSSSDSSSSTSSSSFRSDRPVEIGVEAEDLKPANGQYQSLVLRNRVTKLKANNPVRNQTEASAKSLCFYPLPNFLGAKKDDPFSCLAFPLDQVEARLVDFYVHDYARATFALSSRFQTGQRFFNEIMGSQIQLHATLSRAARELARLAPSSAHYRQMQLAALHHKGETIREINQALHQTVTQNIISATIGIARDEIRHGDYAVGELHFAAVRRMIRTFGRHNLTSPYLIIQARGIEVCAADPNISCFFDQGGLAERVQQLQNAIDELYLIGIDRVMNNVVQASGERYEGPFWQVLRPGSLLHALLSQEVPDPSTMPRSELSEVNPQLVILLGIANSWCQAEDPTRVRESVERRSKQLEKLGIRKHETVINANNMLMDSSRMPIIGSAWDLMEFSNAARHLSFAWRIRLRDWLVRLLEGAMPEPFEKIHLFAFSYAAT